MWSDTRARIFLRQIFDAAVASASPSDAVRRHLPAKPNGRCIVVGAGKASAAMAAALDESWPDVDLSGVVVTRYGHAVPAGRIRVLEASHPVPDEASEAAANTILQAVSGLTPDDLVIAMISGGGSALMVKPAGRMTLSEKQAVNRALLASGATIDEINTVRKHLSQIKGGRLALAARPARLVTLIISDVPGDDPAVVASGPTVADTGTLADAGDTLARYQIALPESVKEVLARGQETPKPGEIAGEVVIVSAPRQALEAAAVHARKSGVTPVILGEAIEGEAAQVGIAMAGIARSVRASGTPVGRPALLLSGGETTVTVAGASAGRGGRNTELLLGFAIGAKGCDGVWAVAGDSDGIDGTEDAAGAFVTPDTLMRGKAAGLDAHRMLRAHDSYSYFDRVGDLLKTGPTFTNVNDIRAILIA